MNKIEAIKLLGGTVSSTARAVGVTPSAITQWPDRLPDRLADRVLAAWARKHLSPELIGGVVPDVKDATSAGLLATQQAA